MMGTILSIIGIVLMFYIFIKTRKIEKQSKARMRELEIIYSVGLKKYDKSFSNKINQINS